MSAVLFSNIRFIAYLQMQPFILPFIRLSGARAFYHTVTHP
jgi:hypothetical protein